jgi:hypothetical protein
VLFTEKLFCPASGSFSPTRYPGDQVLSTRKQVPAVASITPLRRLRDGAGVGKVQRRLRAGRSTEREQHVL